MLLTLLASFCLAAAPLRVPPLAPPLHPGAHITLAAPAGAITRLAVFGDAGTRMAGQLSVAQALLGQHQLTPFSSALVLGDNVYNQGEEAHFDASIRDVYAGLFKDNVPFLPILGNHDVRERGGDAQREYWGVPRWYSATLGDVEVFALDTTVLLYDLPDMKRSYKGREDELAKLKAEQLDWLEAALSKSQAKHKIVMGHHPLYFSSTEREPGKPVEGRRMRELIDAMLKRHGVKLYLAGHQHQYERSGSIGGVVHVTSGAGGMLEDRPIFHQSGVSVVLEKERHFLVLEAEGDVLRVKAQSPDGRVLDQFVLGPIRPSAS